MPQKYPWRVRAVVLFQYTCVTTSPTLTAHSSNPDSSSSRRTSPHLPNLSSIPIASTSRSFSPIQFVASPDYHALRQSRYKNDIDIYEKSKVGENRDRDSDGVEWLLTPNMALFDHFK